MSLEQLPPAVRERIWRSVFSRGLRVHFGTKPHNDTLALLAVSRNVCREVFVVLTRDVEIFFDGVSDVHRFWNWLQSTHGKRRKIRATPRVKTNDFHIVTIQCNQERWFHHHRTKPVGKELAQSYDEFDAADVSAHEKKRKVTELMRKGQLDGQVKCQISTHLRDGPECLNHISRFISPATLTWHIVGDLRWDEASKIRCQLYNTTRSKYPSSKLAKLCPLETTFVRYRNLYHDTDHWGNWKNWAFRSVNVAELVRDEPIKSRGDDFRRHMIEIEAGSSASDDWNHMIVWSFCPSGDRFRYDERGLITFEDYDVSE